MNFRQGGLPDLRTYNGLWNQIWPEHKEDLASLERDYQILPVEKQTSFWLAEKEGVPVGLLECYRNDGSYHPLKWFAYVGVLPEHRGDGIGGALWDIASEFLAGHGAKQVTTRVSDQDPVSLRFASQRGFEEVKRDFESVLYLDKVDQELLERMSHSDAQIVPAAELDSPEFRREWHEVFEEVRKDTPRAAPPTPMKFEEYQEQVLNDPFFLWSGSQIALIDGKMAGFSGLYSTEEPGELYQWLTALLRPYRGRDIAQALKAHLTKWAIENGYRRIRTDNDTRNAAMLSINDRMGFERLFGMITMVKKFGGESPG